MTYEKNEQPQGTDVPREQLEQSERKDGSMSIIAHLEELRKRLIYSIAAVVVGSGAAYFYIDEIMHYLTAPAGKLCPSSFTRSGDSFCRP